MKKYIATIFCLCSLLAEAKINKTIDNNFLDYEATSISELIKQIKKHGSQVTGQHVWAKLYWDLNVEYRYKSNSNGCQFIAEGIYVVAEITLPRWTNVSQTSPKVQAWWQKFSDFITQHELTHSEKIVQHAEKLANLLKKPTIYPSCKESRSAYLAIKQEILNDIYRADKSLDSIAKRRFNANDELFTPLKESGSVFIIESGPMRSYIGL